MKSSLILTAGCLMAALTVGDTVYRIAPRDGRTYADLASLQGGLGDLSGLTGDDEDAMVADLDGLFAESKNGLDADELAAIRQLAAIAKPHDSSWGKSFYEDGSGAGVSPYTMKSVTGAFDPTLSANIAGGATSGPLSYFSASLSGGDLVDQYAIAAAGGSSDESYGGGAGGGASAARRASAAIASSLSAGPVAVPEPASLSLLGLTGLALLRRRRSR